MEVAELFLEHRNHMFSVAYRMLGSAMDAEDVVQEAFLELTRNPPHEIQKPRQFLGAVAARRAIDALRRNQRRRESYVGPWLPEPLPDSLRPADDPAVQIERRESVSVAFLLLMEKLNPVERAVFLLRRVFDYEYEEIGAVVERSAEACRQILHRADAHLTEPRPRAMRPQASSDQQQALFQRFLLACQGRDQSALVQLLRADAKLYSDGGGKVAAALNVIETAENIARFLVGVLDKFPIQNASYEFCAINGEPGLVIRTPAGVESTFSARIEDDVIVEIYSVRNPDKLAWLAAHAVDGGRSPSAPVDDPLSAGSSD
jgi:RNA polymerase sigma-70 factor, ECF subfamily